MKATRFLSHGLINPIMNFINWWRLVLIAVKYAHCSIIMQYVIWKAPERWHTGTLSAFQYRAWLRPLLSDQTLRKWLTLGLCAASFIITKNCVMVMLPVGVVEWLWGCFYHYSVFLLWLHTDLISRLWHLCVPGNVLHVSAQISLFLFCLTCEAFIYFTTFTLTALLV